MIPCDCPECQPEIVTEQLEKGIYIATMAGFLHMGHGKSHRGAMNDLLDYYYAATEGLN